MSGKTLIVTAANDRYFDFARSCITSIRENFSSDNYELAFLDTGCSTEQRDWLSAHVDRIRAPESHFQLAADRPDYLLGLLARPFLRDYFTGFETYLWIDADAWLQRSVAIELLIQGAQHRRGLALVPEVDRGSRLQYGGLPRYFQHTLSWYKSHFGQDLADRLYTYPMLNAGVFALHQSAPHWEKWASAIELAIRGQCTTMTDQLALNVVVYAMDCFAKTELMPAWCNWTCHFGFPIWDEAARCFIEPYLPRTEIGVMHVTTRDKTTIRDVATTTGQRQRVHLFYPPHSAA